MPRRKNLGLVEELQVLTYGEPGQRTFNISAHSRHGSGIVWLEKEQLFDISDSLARAMDILNIAVDPNIDEDDDLGGPDDDDDDWENDTVEFKAWQIAMEYDDRRKLFRFEAAGPELDAELGNEVRESDFNRVSFFFSQHDARLMAERGVDIVYAGRPLCPHCGAPLNNDQDHLCERRNGHNPDEARALIDAIGDR